MEENFRQNNQFVCYFCNELIKNDAPENHLAVCGLVLEPCPNKCGAYVQRNTKRKHLKECPNAWRSAVNLIGNGSLDPAKEVASLDRRFPKQAPPLEPTTMYRNIQMELSRICGRLQTLEQGQRNNSDLSSLSRKCQEDSFAIRNAQTDLRRAIEKLQYQSQIVFEWKRHVDTLLENFKQKGEKNKAEQLSALLESVISDVNLMGKEFKEDLVFNRAVQDDLRAKIEEVKDIHAQDNTATAALWSELKGKAEEALETAEKLSKCMEEHKLKFNTVVFDLRSVSQTAMEAAQKSEILERDFARIGADVAQIKLDLEALEERDSSCCNISSGRLLWKVTDFAAKMKNAKENGVVLKSPAFYTHEYGYKIRLLLYLDGLKKWKGRHALAAIHVLKGEYDLLQKWPCYIEGNIILHDLLDRVCPRLVSKYIAAKRLYGDEENEEPDETSSQYVFIPHTTLIKERYIREDCLFVEIKIIPKANTESTPV